MNEYDSLRMLNILLAHGFSEAASYDDADCIILNTCTVRQKAEDKIYSELGRIKKLKRKKNRLIAGVGGCLGQQEGKALLKKYPYVDFIFGTKTFAMIADMIRAAERSPGIVSTAMPEQTLPYPSGLYDVEATTVSAFVTIMQGCNNFCSYCIVPYVRGPELSRTPSDIVQEVRHLSSCGVKEVILLGQNVNSYRYSFNKHYGFPDLLSDIASVEGIQRIRFTTSHPKDLTAELVNAFVGIDKLCNHIHLPLQSGSNRVLKKMNRRYTREIYYSKIQDLRNRVPEIGITSDIIVGFPGETERDFQDTLEMIESIQFDDLYVFHYTDRKHTRAAGYGNKIPYETKIRRLSRVNGIQRDISLHLNRKMIGRTLPVLIDRLSRKSDQVVAGKTEANKHVNCRGAQDIIGSVSPVKIVRANVHSLFGTVHDS